MLRLLPVSRSHRRPRVAIRRQPGPGGLLELVEHPVDVLVAWPVLRGPGDHARRVLVLELQRVGHCGHGVRIAAQDRHVLPDLALAVQLAREVVGRGLGRARAVREELNQHRPRPARAAALGRARWRPGGREPRRPRGRRPHGCAPSARSDSGSSRCAQSAGCARATSRAGAVQICVRAIAWRSSSDSDTPAAAALACHAASSASLTRACAMAGRGGAGRRRGMGSWMGVRRGSAAAPSPGPM